MILRTGIDIVEVKRIEQIVSRKGEKFLRRVFTPDEISHCWPEKHRFRRFAARYAAKEAVLKALGTGLRRGRWLDVEITKNHLGKPSVRLSGRLADLARDMGVGSIELSISHSRHYAVAHALLLLEPQKIPK